MQSFCGFEWENFTFLFSLTSNWNLSFLSIVNAGNKYGNISSTYNFVTSINHRYIYSILKLIICLKISFILIL